MFIIEDSYQQIAIMMVNGKSANAITKHIMKKYFFILLCVVISGSLSGYIINTLIFKNNSQINIYHIFYMILLFFIKFIYIFIISLCQLKNIKYKLINYINQISKIDNKVGYFSSFIVDKEKKSFPYIKLTAICVLLIIFIGATKMIITKNINTIDFITGLTGLTISFLLITKLLFPILFDFFHRRLLKHKVFMIAFNDFITLYHTTFTLITISIVVLPFMIYFLITAAQTAIYLICYSMIHISLILCYFFRYYVYFNNKHKQILIYQSLGYRINNIKQIQYIESIMHFIYIAIFPLILIIHMILKSNMINPYILYLFTLYILSFNLLYFINKTIINKKIKELIQ